MTEEITTNINKLYKKMQVMTFTQAKIDYGPVSQQLGI